MCLAIPFGGKIKNNQFVLWHTLHSSPLYLLSAGAAAQLLLVVLLLDEQKTYEAGENH